MIYTRFQGQMLYGYLDDCTFLQVTRWGDLFLWVEIDTEEAELLPTPPPARAELLTREQLEDRINPLLEHKFLTQLAFETFLKRQSYA